MPKKTLFTNSSKGKQGTLSSFFGVPKQPKSKPLNPTTAQFKRAKPKQNQPAVQHTTGFIKASNAFNSNNNANTSGFTNASNAFKNNNAKPFKRFKRPRTTTTASKRVKWQPPKQTNTTGFTKASTASSSSSSSSSLSSTTPTTTPLRRIELPTVIVGRQHHPHQPTTFNHLTLQRDSNNKYDFNAVLVVDTHSTPPLQPLGHLPRRISNFIAPLMDHNTLDTNPVFRIPPPPPAPASPQSTGATTLSGTLCFAVPRLPSQLTVPALSTTAAAAAARRHHPKVLKALQDLNKALAKQRSSLSKAAAKVNAKRKRTQGPQQQTIGQTFLRNASKKMERPSHQSSRLLNTMIPVSVLQYMFVVGNLTPTDMCAVRRINRAFQSMVDDPTFMKFTLASYRSPAVLTTATMSTQLFEKVAPTTLTMLFDWCRASWSRTLHEDDQMTMDSAYLLLGHVIGSAEASLLEQIKRVVHHFKNTTCLISSASLASSSATPATPATPATSSASTKRVDGWFVLAVALVCNLTGTQRHALVRCWMQGHGSRRRRRGLVREYISALICVLKTIGHRPDDHDDQETTAPPPWLNAPFFRVVVELRSAIESGARSLLFPSAYQRPSTSMSSSSATTSSATSSSSTTTSTTTTQTNTSNKPTAAPPLTDEQLAIVRCRLKPKDVVKVAAFAGSGKTTTLVELARAHPSKRFLYLAFNVSVRDHATTIFPSNTKAKGIHQLAFARTGRMYANNLIPSLQADSIMRAYPSTTAGTHGGGHSGLSGAPEICQAIVDTLTHFCASAEYHIQTLHVPDYIKHTGGGAAALATNIEEDLGTVLKDIASPLGVSTITQLQLVRLAKVVWTSMKSTLPPSMQSNVVPMSHDGYLKLYQLRKPVLDIDYDVILLDEAQDTNPAIQDIIMRQKCAKVIVGDRHQAIYSFIGAEDTLSKVQATRTLTLTKSFRFGFQIANVANLLLHSMTSETRVLIGHGKHEGDVEDLFDTTPRSSWWGDWPPHERPNVVHRDDDDVAHVNTISGGGGGGGSHPTHSTTHPTQSYAVLTRTNSTIFQIACELMDRKKVFLFIGGVSGYGFSDILDTAYVLNGSNLHLVVNAFLKRFKTPEQLIRYATATSNQDMLSRIKMIEGLGGPSTVMHLCKRLIKVCQKHEDMYGRLVTQHYKMDLVLLSTVHKAKGLEFNNVLLADDFVDLLDGDLKDKVLHQERGFVDEFNLIYVGVTRCKRRLRLGPTLKRYLYSTGMLIGLQHDVVVEGGDGAGAGAGVGAGDGHVRTCLGCNVKENHARCTKVGSVFCHVQTMSGRVWKYACPNCSSNHVL